jgi:hypothetical protein
LAAAAQSESITLKLEQQIDAAADAATGALGRLERQTQREQNALGRLESGLSMAKARLVDLAAGVPSPAAAAAFERQGAAVAALEARMAAAKTPTAALAAQLEKARAKLETLRAAGTGQTVNIEAYKKQANAVGAMGDKAAAQRDKIEALGQRLKTAAKAADGSHPPFAAVAKSLKMVGGELGASEAKGVRFVHLLIKMGPALALTVVGFAAASVAAASYAGSLFKGIKAAGEMRDENLKLAAAGVRWNDSSRASVNGALAVQNAITRVRESSALSREELAGYADQLLHARLRGKQLETALEGMSIAGSAGRKDLADQFLVMAANTRVFGGSVDKLTDRMKQKLGGVASAAALSFGAQMRKLKDDITFGFSGANIEPLLKGIQSVLSLFGSGSATAKSMRQSITDMVERSIGAFLKMERAVLQWVVSMPEGTFTDLANGAKEFGRAVIDLLPPLTETLKTALEIMKLEASAVVNTGRSGASGGGGDVAGGGDLPGLSDKNLAAMKAFDKYAKPDAEVKAAGVNTGEQYIAGVVKGVDSKLPDVGAVANKAANSLIAGVHGPLEIESPSRVMMRAGMHTGAGLAIGMDRSARIISISAARMARAAMVEPANQNGPAQADAGFAAPPSFSFSPPQMQAAPSAPAASGLTLQFNNCVFSGTTKEAVEQLMIQVWEAQSRTAMSRTG